MRERFYEKVTENHVSYNDEVNLYVAYIRGVAHKIATLR